MDKESPRRWAGWRKEIYNFLITSSRNPLRTFLLTSCAWWPQHCPLIQVWWINHYWRGCSRNSNYPPFRKMHWNASQAAHFLRALQHLYKLGLTYRNLKADNCVVAEDSHLILIDMDLSHHCNPYAKPPEFNKCRRKRIQDERVMVWGMHWVIWQISQATEKNPWPERSEKQIPYFEEPVPAAMELLLRKGLQKIPEQRPPLEEAIKEWEAAMIQYNQSALLMSWMSKESAPRVGTETQGLMEYPFESNCTMIWFSRLWGSDAAPFDHAFSLCWSCLKSSAGRDCDLCSRTDESEVT